MLLWKIIVIFCLVLFWLVEIILFFFFFDFYLVLQVKTYPGKHFLLKLTCPGIYHTLPVVLEEKTVHSQLVQHNKLKTENWRTHLACLGKQLWWLFSEEAVFTDGRNSSMLGDISSGNVRNQFPLRNIG